MYAFINILFLVLAFHGLALIGETVGQDCPRSKGKLSDIKKLSRELAKIIEEVCEKTNNVVPDAFVTETTNCVEQYIKPCLKIKAPIIMEVMKHCVEDNRYISGDKFCDKETQDKVIACGELWLETQQKIRKEFTINMGLIKVKGRLFKNCINENSIKTLDASQ